MKSRVVIFPFDQFGSAGTGAGAELLGDAVLEMLQDADEETVPNRATSYQSAVAVSEFPFTTPNHFARWQATAREAFVEFQANEEFLIWVAGNHLALLPVYEALGPDTLVIQFDAHLDVYNLSDCTDELSHGNFLMFADNPLPNLVNVGSRDCFLAPEHALQYFRTIHSATRVAADPGGVGAQLLATIKKAKRVWIDIDCDVFDPAFFPAVQHPQPFGLAPTSVLGFLERMWSKKIIGVSLSEFDPGRDRNDQSLATLIWLVEWLLLRAHGALDL